MFRAISIVRIAISLMIFLACHSVMAGSLSYPKEGTMLFDGEIATGDSEAMAAQMSKNRTFILMLNSMGGNVDEAMRMVAVIKGMNLRVAVAHGGLCASACFFLYLAGNSRNASNADDDGMLPKGRRSDILGYVGIHRPYLSVSSGDMKAAKKQETMMQKMRGYLVSERVPQNLIDEMMSRPSNDSYWLSNRDLELIGEYSPGQEEALISKCGYKRMIKQVAERWDEARKDRLLECEASFWGKNLMPLQEQYRARLQTGWRPWK